MKVIIISSSDKTSSEIPFVIKLFKECHLETFHLRKTKFSTRRLKEYLDQIPEKYRSKIIIHSHHKLAFKYNLKGIHFTRTHLKNRFKCRCKMFWYRIRRPGISITRSFHHIESLTSNRLRYSYAFLNPIFSKTDPTKNHFDISIDHINKLIKDCPIPIYASGNITDENVELLKQFKFEGVALSKIIWESDRDKLQYFKDLNQLLDSKSNG